MCKYDQNMFLLISFPFGRVHANKPAASVGLKSVLRIKDASSGGLDHFIRTGDITKSDLSSVLHRTCWESQLHIDFCRGDFQNYFFLEARPEIPCTLNKS